MNDSTRRFIVTVGYSGLVPRAPGTAGTLVSALILAFALTLAYRLGASHWASQVIIVGIGSLAALACVQLGPWTVAHFGKKDPGPCVIDETAGFCITMLFLPITSQGLWLTVVLAFIAFRVFDIIKPPPAKRLERLPSGWGILMDDLLAGLYANIACQILLRVIV
jgi:phosphatidylglycerophosphatase A